MTKLTSEERIKILEIASRFPSFGHSPTQAAESMERFAIGDSEGQVFLKEFSALKKEQRDAVMNLVRSFG